MYHKAKNELYKAIIDVKNMVKPMEEADEALWKALIVYQNFPFYTAQGLPFEYSVKRNRSGMYSGELIVNRKEGSKTLTRSSVMFAFHKVMENVKIADCSEEKEIGRAMLVFPEYKGPKAIGQIFGISYVYSIFWRLGLIEAPEKVADRLGK